MPRIEEPGRLQYMRLQRVGHKLVTEHTHILKQREVMPALHSMS